MRFFGRPIISSGSPRAIGRQTPSGSGRLPPGMGEKLPLLPGTLEMLVLQTLIFGPRHGHGIATTIQRTSSDLLLVDHGSLYPALQRLERAGLISSEWGTSDNNRRARYYNLTRPGRKKLADETGKWEKIVRAVKGVLQARPGEEHARGGSAGRIATTAK